MSRLAPIVAAVAALQSVAASAEHLLGALHDKLSAAVAADDMDEVAGIVESINAQKAELAAAITANTPADPTGAADPGVSTPITDTIASGSGSDTVSGATGDESASASGADTSTDSVSGGAAEDTLVAGGGEDTIQGGQSDT